ncbi:dermonecrotic toxin SPH-like isoform X1 [Dermacentor variabilis]|uniref:dermonecrotic toxin SPH-like isoform X1 n=2 Tax=Dermacentor variabilis TaxID=34621 RepID=UPI003F5C3E03
MKLLHSKKGAGAITCLKINSLLSVVFAAAATSDLRPLFVFGHMANSLEELDDFMAQGVNAIEADVSFASNGTALKFYHGPGCDCGRYCQYSTEITTYLSYLRDSVNEGGKYADKLLLFYADIKTSGLYGDNKYEAGVSLANNLMRYLWSNVPSDHMLDVIISVFSVSDKDVFRGALDAISQAENSSVYLDHVGFDVSGYNLLDTIAGTYEDLGVVRHRWQGDGSTNCLIDIYPTVRTHAVTSRRTAHNTTHDYVDKAYVWTADHSTTIRRFLRAGIDGILSNVPTNVLSILHEDEFSKIFKLATSEDDPWLRIP